MDTREKLSISLSLFPSFAALSHKFLHMNATAATTSPKQASKASE